MPILHDLSDSGLTFAFLCLLFSGLNDYVFKRMAIGTATPGGLNIAAVGVVWFSLQSFFYTLSGDFSGLSLNHLLFSLIPGFLLFLSNILYIESMAVLDASLASTVYRLNSVPAVLLSVVFLGDFLDMLRFTGFILSVAAVIMLYEKKEKISSGKYLLFVLICGAASFLRAIYAFVSKSLIISGIENSIINIVSSFSWILFGTIYSLVVRKRIDISSVNVRYSVVSGFFCFMISVFLLKAMARGNLSIIMPLTNMGFVIAYMLSAARGMETLTARKIAAMLFAGSAIAVLSFSG